MESLKKMSWHSSAISLNASSITGSQTSVKSNYRSRDNQSKIQELPDDNEKSNILIKGINETIAENNSLIKDSLNFLKTLDINPSSLSKDTNDDFDKLTAIINIENLQSIDITALTIIKNRSKRDELKKLRIERNLKKKYENLCYNYGKLEAKINNVQDRVNYISDYVEKLRDNNEKDYSEIIHKAIKLSEYNKTAENLTNNLAELNIADEYPDKILNKYKYYLGATGELAELNKIINQYGELPADILQAKAALEQKEKKRIEVKNLLDKRMIQ